jgi:hypothetical protein
VEVSNLQQHNNELRVEHLVAANHVLKLARAMIAKGDKLIFKEVPGELGTLVASDASFAQQPHGGSQQGYIIGVMNNVRTRFQSWHFGVELSKDSHSGEIHAWSRSSSSILRLRPRSLCEGHAG